MLRDSANDNNGVIGILENRARKIVDKRVKKQTLPRGHKKELLENIGNNIKKKGGERVALPEPSTALDPPARDAIKKNSSLAS
jgi:hypothetical protein